MAESLADVKISAATDAEAKALVNMLLGKGATNVTKLLAGTGQGVVSAKLPTSQVPSAQAQFPKGSASIVKTNEDAATSALSLGQRLKKSFTSKNARDMQKSLFILQMSSLGVVFSFTSIMNSAMGLFSGLQDLGAMISGGAMGTAFAGLATGGANTTNIAETMGVTPEMATQAWAGFTAIVNQFKAVFDALAVKVLSPQMVEAILAVIDALAGELAKPEVSKAIHEIIIAVLELALALIPLIPVIASVVNWLGDTGLLKFLLLILFAAQVLLPALAYIQFVFTGIMTVAEIVGGVIALLGISLGWLLIIVGVVLIAIDFLIHLFENLSNGMDPLDAVLTAMGQTVADVINLIIGVLNPILGFLGMGKIEYWSTASGHEPATTQKATTVVNNINFNKNVNTADKKSAAAMVADINNASMG